MRSNRPQSRKSTLLLLLLLTFMGAQTLESSHQHALGDTSNECSLCQSYSGSLATVSTADTHYSNENTPIGDARVLAPTTTAAYSPPARGPPLNT